MLFLTRKIGEAVIINNDVEVTVVKINRSTVKLSFTYPQETTQILRKEVFLRIQEENQQAADSVSIFKDAIPDMKALENHPLLQQNPLKKVFSPLVKKPSKEDTEDTPPEE